jgi:chorismate mutase/prephenate dehydratase
VVVQVKVAFQGEIGAYSESAVYSHFNSSVQVKPCRNLTDVFESVEKGETSYGVVPIENSIEGSVTQTYDLFFTHNLKVCGETIIKIAHCLITNPKTSLDSIEVVYSHPQALAQCRSFLESLGCDLIPTYDTAGSVKMMKEKKLMNAGAVASERAAEIYGMKVFAKRIADNPNNYTRFFVISEVDSPLSGKDKTSIIFSLKDRPGALYYALEEFAVRDINLTKIESRPTKQEPWEYNFYLDFEGHRTEERCQEALKAIEKKSAFLKVLGSYPRAAKEF